MFLVEESIFDFRFSHAATPCSGWDYDSKLEETFVFSVLVTTAVTGRISIRGLGHQRMVGRGFYIRCFSDGFYSDGEGVRRGKRAEDARFF